MSEEEKEAIEKIFIACTNYDKEISNTLGTKRKYEGSYEQAFDIIIEMLKELLEE